MCTLFPKNNIGGGVAIAQEVLIGASIVSRIFEKRCTVPSYVIASFYAQQLQQFVAVGIPPDKDLY